MIKNGDEFHPKEDLVYSLFEYQDGLHQSKVHIHSRQEDGRTKSVCIDQRTGAIDASKIGNPSARRQGLVIEFESELDASKTYLHIWQHKGTTLFCYSDRSNLHD